MPDRLPWISSWLGMQHVEAYTPNILNIFMVSEEWPEPGPDGVRNKLKSAVSRCAMNAPNVSRCFVSTKTAFYQEILNPLKCTDQSN